MMKLFTMLALYFGSAISWGETLDFALACSPICLDFRDTFISIVLFRGAYIWIKFREVAFKGVYSRKIVDKRSRISKVVYEPRFKPPRENGQVFEWIYLGQYATPEEASVLYQIAAFYYSKEEGLLALEDGRSFTIPPITERGRSLTGEQKRAWVKDQAKKVYEDFTKEKDEAALLQELVEACQDQVMQGRDEVNVDPSEANLTTDTLHQETAIASQMYNSGMGFAMLGNHGLEGASHPFGGMNEGLGVSNSHSLDFQEGPAIAVSELTPNAHNRMGINQLDLLPTLVHTQQELISCQQQQISLQQQQIQEFRAQISDLQNQQLNLQQQLQESRIQISQLEYQHCLQQQLQDINQGVPSYELDSEQSMHHEYHPS